MYCDTSTHLPRRHCAAFLAAHTWYSAGRTRTPQAFLWKTKSHTTLLVTVGGERTRTCHSEVPSDKPTSSPSRARALPAGEPGRICRSRSLRPCFWGKKEREKKRRLKRSLCIAGFHGNRCFRPLQAASEIRERILREVWTEVFNLLPGLKWLKKTT